MVRCWVHVLAAPEWSAGRMPNEAIFVRSPLVVPEVERFGLPGTREFPRSAHVVTHVNHRRAAVKAAWAKSNIGSE
jgi:hypothetical protein